MTNYDDGACCAHLKVSWRTEEIGGGLTRGWWECDSDCGIKFGPVLAATADGPPEAAQKVMDLWDACSIRGIGVCSRDCEQGRCDTCSAFVELRAFLAAQKEGQ